MLPSSSSPTAHPTSTLFVADTPESTGSAHHRILSHVDQHCISPPGPQKIAPHKLACSLQASSSTPLPQLLGRHSHLFLTFFPLRLPAPLLPMRTLSRPAQGPGPAVHPPPPPPLSQLSPRRCPPRCIPSPVCTFLRVDVPPRALCSETYNPASFCLPLPFSALLLRLPEPREHNHGAPLSTAEGET